MVIFFSYVKLPEGTSKEKFGFHLKSDHNFAFCDILVATFCHSEALQWRPQVFEGHTEAGVCGTGENCAKAPSRAQTPSGVFRHAQKIADRQEGGMELSIQLVDVRGIEKLQLPRRKSLEIRCINMVNTHKWNYV